MAAPKRTPTEREAALTEVARLDRRGASQREIAARLGVCHQQVSYDLRTIRARYAKETQAEHAALVAEKIAQFREQRLELWDAWERSKEDKTRSVKEKVTDLVDRADKGEDVREDVKKLKAVLTTEGRLPEASYQRLILDNLREEAELRSLYPSKKDAPGSSPETPLFIRNLPGLTPDDLRTLRILRERATAGRRPAEPADRQ